MEKIFTCSGSRLAEMVRQKETTSTQLVDSYIRKVQQVNPPINALVRDRFEQARQEAAAADDRIKSEGTENLPPFFGVPCTIKESFGLTGMPNTSGLVSRKGITADSDAPAVARIRNAGAIPLGVTNIPELCMWMETYNRVYGITGNPYDPARIAGGSSGGEGAIIGSGASPFGLGSDIGGSIRMPAFFNGVFGHKPTGGLIPNTGQFPAPEREMSAFCTTGPLCRRAEDLWPLVCLLAGPDGTDPMCKHMELGDPEDVYIDEIRVVNVPGNSAIRVDKELMGAQLAAAQALSSRGAQLEARTIPVLKKSLLIWASMLHEVGATPFGVLLGQGRPVNLLKEVPAWIFKQSPYTLPALGLTLFEKIPAPTRKYVRLGKELKKELEDLLQGDGVMLYPSYSRPAPRHHAPLFLLTHWMHTAIINAMGFPATQVPLGLSRNGLPLGVQVVAGPGNDHLSVAVALELEKIFGGWAPPPGQ